MRRKKEKTRKQITDAAYVLFRRSGFTRVNVDDIAKAAGITKRTLYSHFPSKDALLEAVLREQHTMAFAAFRTFGDKLQGNAEEIASIYFKELVRWATQPKWPGSGFTRLAMELADLPGHPARRMASRHKRLMEEHLANVLEGAGLANPQLRARQIWILTEGSMAMALIHGDKSYLQTAGQAAQELVRTAKGST
jgi:AcrR family transcriptional regulator